MNSSIFSSDFWFNLRPEPLSRGFVIALVVIGILFVIGYIWSMKQKKNKKSWSKFYLKLENFYLTNFILAFVLAFINEQMIPIFSAKFILGIWVLWMLIWLGLIIAKYFGTKNRQQELAEEKKFAKYIPKKSK